MQIREVKPFHFDISSIIKPYGIYSLLIMVIDIAAYKSHDAISSFKESRYPSLIKLSGYCQSTV